MKLKKNAKIIQDMNQLNKNDIEVIPSYNDSSNNCTEIKIKKKVKSIFFVIYPKKVSLFTKASFEEILLRQNKNPEFIKKKEKK